MKDELKETQGFLERISDRIHYFLRQEMPDGLILPTQIMAKILFLMLLIAAITALFQLLVKVLHWAFSKGFREKPEVQAIYDTKILNIMALFIGFAICRNFIEPVMDRHPSTHTILQQLFRIVMIVVAYKFYRRILKTIERYYFFKKDYYRITTTRAVISSLEIVGYIVFGFIGITMLFGVSAGTILGTLGGLTAVILLVFRDTILGFVTGIHVSTSRTVKVGDWIGIPKYNIEGTVQDISLLTTKILNFDKTVSTVPTYDLLTTEIKNHQNIAEGHSRRIKKSIILNANSFKFVDEELVGKLQRINLLSEYINDKQTEILEVRNSLQNPELLINGRQLTNVGLFRQYAKKYLEANPKVDQEEVIMVRQLDVTPQGMPMEIYCFANKTQMLDFENIQADIFDHLLASAREFDLEVLQIMKI